MGVTRTVMPTITGAFSAMAERPRLNYDIGDLERRLGLVAMYATVAEADYQRRRVRVEAGPIRSTWLPWLTQRAQSDRTWHPPEVGEQVMVLAPHGELNQGCVLGAIHAAEPEDRTAPADRPTVERTVYADGTIEEYDREASHRLIDMTAPGGTMTIKTGSTTVLIEPDRVRIEADRIELDKPS